MKKMGYFQQGDILIEAFDKIPANTKKVEATGRGYVLFEGDVTGHAHAIEKVADVDFLEKDGVFYIVNKKPAVVTHEEHKPITIPAGSWRVRGVQEYDHFAEEARRVID